MSDRGPSQMDAEEGHSPSAVQEEPARPSSSHEEEDLVEEYSRHTLSLLWPVCITILIVLGAISCFTPLLNPEDQQPVYLVYHERASDTPSERLPGALLNALIIVAVVLLVTLLLLGLYKARCYRLIGGWLVLSSFALLLSVSWMWVDLTCTAFQIPYDLVTVGLLSFNYAGWGCLDLLVRCKADDSGLHGFHFLYDGVVSFSASGVDNLGPACCGGVL
eukprot:RCo048912